MKTPLLVVAAFLLAACSTDNKTEVNKTAYQSDPVIPVSFHAVQPEDVQGSIRAFGQLESAGEIRVNVDFSAPVAQILVHEGQAVSKGQKLLKLDTEKLRLNLQQTRFQLEEAQSRARNAKMTSDRLVALTVSNNISQQQLDDAMSDVEMAESQVKALVTQIALIQRDIKNSTVISPVNAVINERYVQAGEVTEPFQPLFSLEPGHSIRASVYVNEKSATVLSVGNRARVDAATGRFETDIYSIAARSSQETGNFEVKLLLDNPEGQLKPGMTTSAVLFTDTLRDRLVLPAEALVSYQGEYVVYRLADEDGQHIARRTPVMVEMGFDDLMYVTSGLVAGDQVITGGAQTVTEGSLVRLDSQATDPTGGSHE